MLLKGLCEILNARNISITLYVLAFIGLPIRGVGDARLGFSDLFSRLRGRRKSATIHNHKKFHEPRELRGIALTFHLAWRRRCLLKKPRNLVCESLSFAVALRSFATVLARVHFSVAASSLKLKGAAFVTHREGEES